MSKKFTTRIQHKRATEAEWLKAKNFTPLEGELIIYEVDAAHKAPRFKIGDGSTKVNDLPFFNAANLATMGKDSFSAGAGIRLSGQTFEIDVIGTIGPIDLSTLSIYSNVSAGATSIQIKSTSPITKELFDKLQEAEYNGIIVQIGNEIVPIKNYDSFEKVSIIPLAYKATLYLMDGFTIQSAISAGTAITEVYMGGAVGEYSFASNNKSLALGDESHAEGSLTTTTKEGIAAHAEGYLSIADGLAAHAEGTRTTASAGNAHAEGYRTIASGGASHAEGSQTKATSDNAHAEGNVTEATAASAHAEGYNTKATATAAHAEGTSSTASANYSHAEGYSTTAGGSAAHAEGWSSQAQNPYSHAEGLNTTASGDASHAEGSNTVASGTASHAEGIYTHAIGAASHAQGTGSVATGVHSSAFGNTSKAGYGNQFIVGAFNDNKANTVFEVGNGSKEDEVDKNGNVITKNRSNAFEVYHDGHAELKKQGTTDNSVVIKNGLKTINGESIIGSGDIKVTSSVTPDWDQWDPAQPDYIKNKTHGVITAGKEFVASIDDYDNGNMIKVSDEIITIEELQNCIITFNEDGEEEFITKDYTIYEIEGAAEAGVSAIGIQVSQTYRDYNAIMIITAIDYNKIPEGTPEEEIPTPGIYFNHIHYLTPESSGGGGGMSYDFYTTKLQLVGEIKQLDEKYLPDMKTINGESILGEGNIEIKVVQPDWNQNDPTQPDYVKNRTHYMEESIEGITFDGNLDGRVVADAYDGDFKIVKVSDDLPSAEDLIGQTVIFTYQDGRTVEYSLEEENIGIGDRNLWITHIIDRVMYPSLFIVNSSEEAANDIGGNPEDIPLGTYFVYAVDNFGYYISSYASVTRNIKKIDEKFLPELATVAKTGSYNDLVDAPDVYTRDVIDTNFATKTYADSIDIRRIVGERHNSYTILLLTDIGTTENATLKLLKQSDYMFDTSIDISNVAVDLYDNGVKIADTQLSSISATSQDIKLYGDGELLTTTLTANTTESFKPISFTFTPQSNISELYISTGIYQSNESGNKFPVNLKADTKYTLIISTNYQTGYSTISFFEAYICEGEPYASITSDDDGNLDVSNLTIPETFCVSTDIRCSLQAKYQVCEQHKLIPTLNIKNSTGTLSLQQTQDSKYTGILLYNANEPEKSKNLNAVELDEALKSEQPIGATGDFATSLGGVSSAQGKRSVAEGTNTIAKGKYSHAEGNNSVALGNDSHAEGLNCVSFGSGSHSEGGSTQAIGMHAHSEGVNTITRGDASHAGGSGSIANGIHSFAHGNNVIAGYDNQFVVGRFNNNRYDSIFEVGLGSDNGSRTTCFYISQDNGAAYRNFSNDYSPIYDPNRYATQSEISQAITIEVPIITGSAVRSLVLRESQSSALYDGCVALGIKTAASGIASAAFNSNTQATGNDSSAIGRHTLASGIASHSQGYATQAIGDNSHSEGDNTIAKGVNSHAEGTGSQAKGAHSHAQGNHTQALADNSSAAGNRTIARYANQFVVGKFNDYNKTVDEEYFIVGAGNAENDRVNAFTVGRSLTTNESYIKIGDIELTETQLIKLKALLNE